MDLINLMFWVVLAGSSFIVSSPEDIQKNYNFSFTSSNYNQVEERSENNFNLVSPQGFQPTGFNCRDIPNSLLSCDKHGNILSIKTGYCITFNTNTDVLEVGQCLYNTFNRDLNINDRNLLPSNSSLYNEDMCGKFNRKGTLCGECKEGYNVPVYSYDLACVKCSHRACDWWKFVLIAFVPLTLFYIVVVAFKINLFSTFLYGYVMFCQAITPVQVARYQFIMAEVVPTWLKYLGSVFVTFYSVWNLDFFRFYNSSICFQIGPLDVVSLELVVAAYPVLLTAVAYLIISVYDRNSAVISRSCWKPFRQLLEQLSNISDSIIGAFSTFFFLLGMKCLTVCVDYLASVRVYEINPTSGYLKTKLKVNYNPNLVYFGNSHLPYALTGILIFLVVGLLPILLICTYPSGVCQRCLQCLLVPRSWHIGLHLFMDTIQGCFKDGTDSGTRDFRWFSGVTFAARLALMTVFMSVNITMYRVIAAQILLLTLIIFIIIDPFKSRFKKINTSIATFTLLIVSCYVIAIIAETHFLSKFIYFLIGVFGILPAFYIIGQVLYNIYVKCST